MDTTQPLRLLNISCVVDDVSVAMRPYLAFGPGKETIINEPCNQIYVKMPLVIVGLVSPSATWSTTSASINNLIDDVIAAMFTDHTRGGYAMCSKLIGCETDEPDPDMSTDGACCIIEFEIEYIRTMSAS